MTVVFGLSNLLQELKKASDGVALDTIWENTHSNLNPSPVDLSKFGKSIDESDTQLSAGRSPKKTGSFRSSKFNHSTSKQTSSRHSTARHSKASSNSEKHDVSTPSNVNPPNPAVQLSVDQVRTEKDPHSHSSQTSQQHPPNSLETDLQNSHNNLQTQNTASPSVNAVVQPLQKKTEGGQEVLSRPNTPQKNRNSQEISQQTSITQRTGDQTSSQTGVPEAIAPKLAGRSVSPMDPNKKQVNSSRNIHTTSVITQTTTPAVQTGGILAMIASSTTPIRHPKVITFELPSTFSKMTKEPIPDTESLPDSPSALSKLLGAGDVQVYVPGVPDPINVKVSPTALILQLIVQTIKTYNATKPTKKLEESPDAYNVRIALENGQIDDMFPALAKKGTVDQWSNVAFILVENPNFKPTQSHHTKAESISGGYSQTLSSSTGAVSDRLGIKVTLPSGAFHTFIAEPNLKIGKLLQKLCAKRQLVASQHTLRTSDKVYLSSDTRVSDLKDLNLILEPKDSGGAGALHFDAMIWSDMTASAYKLYSSLLYYKSKKKGSAPASMAVDGDKIVVSIQKKTETRTITLLLPELRTIRVTDDNPLVFEVETTKEKEKILYFETSSKMQTNEIVGKIGHLIEMHANQTQL